MRVVNREARHIGYRLNLLGVRVFQSFCQLIGRQGEEWVTIGTPRPLPLVIPDDPAQLASDPLLLTAHQFDSTWPGSDIRDVMSQAKNFEEALSS